MNDLIQKISHALRDEGCRLRMEADRWAKLGATETAAAFASRANTLDHAVKIVWRTVDKNRKNQ